MRALTPRGIISEAAIVLGVCAGLGMGVISRFDSEKQDVERDLASATRLLAERGQLEQSHSQWVIQRDRARTARASLLSLSEPAASAATLHERIMLIARSCDVRIDRIQPSQQTPVLPAPASDDPAAPPPVRPSVVLANTIEAGGRYDSIVRFIEQVEMLGLGRVNDVRISPVDDGVEQLVHASLNTVHFAFDGKATMAPQASVPGVTP